jgi:hypothetical protein
MQNLHKKYTGFHHVPRRYDFCSFSKYYFCHHHFVWCVCFCVYNKSNYNNGWPRKRRKRRLAREVKRDTERFWETISMASPSPLFDYFSSTRRPGLIHKETRGVSKVPWKPHLWRCHLHRARSQTDCHCHGRFIPSRDRDALFTDSKVKYLRVQKEQLQTKMVFSTPQLWRFTQKREHEQWAWTMSMN